MQAVGNTACEDLLRSAANPSNPLHNVYLLMELRKQKKELSNKYVQKHKSELAKKLAESQQSLETNQFSHVTKTKRSSLGYNSGAGDSRRGNEKRNSFPPGDCRIIPKPTLASKKSVSTAACCNVSDSSSLSELASISEFFSVLELISKFYNISNDAEFMRNRNQLIETLGLLKNYKSFDDVLSNLIKKLQNLCDVKRRFNDVIGEEVTPLYSTENLLF